MKLPIYSCIFFLIMLTACAVQPAAQAPTNTPPPAEPTGTPLPPPNPTAEAQAHEPSLPTEAGELESNTWQWVSFTSPVEQYDIELPGSYLLTFNQDGTLNIKADCNNAAGSYTAEGSSLTIQVGPTTMAACPSGSLSDRFVEYLGFSAVYFFEGGNLFIDMMADGGTMQFAPGE